MLLLAAEAPVSPHDFNPSRENLGMLTMAVVVLVFWLLYRQMIELTKRRAARATPWKDALTQAGVTGEFLEVLERCHLPEEPWPWLKMSLLGSDNRDLFARDVSAYVSKLGAERVVPVYAEGKNDVLVLWVKDAKGARFVRFSPERGELREFPDFQAVLAAMLQQAVDAGVEPSQVRRLGESVGFVGLEAFLARLAPKLPLPA